MSLVENDILYNFDAEKGVLAACVRSPEALDFVQEILTPTDFYNQRNVTFFKILLDLWEGGRPIDLVTVNESFKSIGDSNSTSIKYIEHIFNEVPIPISPLDHAMIVKEKSARRNLIGVSKEISRRASNASISVEEIFSFAEGEFLSASMSNAKYEFAPIGDTVDDVLRKIEQATLGNKGLTGIPSGFKSLDDLTAGFQNSDLIVIAARTSMGKTALALNFARNIASKGLPVAIFSLEMSRESLTMRLVCSGSGVSMHQLSTGSVGRQEMDKVFKVASDVANLPIYIDDSGALTTLELKSRARRIKKERGIGLVVVDYLQLMSATRTNRSYENRVAEVSEITRALKVLAKDLGVPVIALSQLSRQVESRQDKRPILSDLRDSGSVEQDADLVLFIYRDEYYSRDGTPEDLRGVAEVIIGKQRNGPTGVVMLRFDKHTSSFSDNLDVSGGGDWGAGSTTSTPAGGAYA